MQYTTWRGVQPDCGCSDPDPAAGPGAGVAGPRVEEGVVDAVSGGVGVLRLPISDGLQVD